jgi:hypothetical protein
MVKHAPEVLDFLDDHWCNVMWAHSQAHPLGPTPEECLQKLKELRERFLDELYEMPPEFVANLVMETLHEQDRARPFHAFGTQADFAHYGRCAFLTAIEAVPLSLGKDPSVVTFELVRPYLGASLFANDYAKRLDLIERAILFGELEPRFTPLEFLTWAHKYKLPVPAAFVQQTFVRGEPIQYWHELCEALRARLLETEAALECSLIAKAALEAAFNFQTQETFEEWIEKDNEATRLRNVNQDLVALLYAERAEADSKLSELQKEVDNFAAQNDNSDALPTSERKSLLTMVAAMAVDVYGYDPMATKSPTPALIAGAALRIGLKTTDDTARKYLTEARSLKGFTAPDMVRTKPKSGRSKPKSA